MGRVRISTTVDSEILRQARDLAGGRDAELLDRAFAALIERIETEREATAMDQWPYAIDPELAMPDPLADDLDALPYDGAVPREVVEMARRRRKQR